MKRLILLAVFLTHPVHVQAQASDVFTRLAGHWTGTGELMGNDAFFEMTWQPTGWGAATLHFANGFVAADGARTPVLSATALYSTVATSPQATWLDSRGERLTIEWRASGPNLTAIWRSSSEQGRTEYVVVSNDEVRVTDYVGSDGAERVFGSAVYARAEQASAPGASSPEAARSPQRAADGASVGAYDPALESVTWLAGCWRSASGTRVMDEQWMAPLGNAMLGMNRTIRAGRLSAFEQLRIETRDGRATYVAHPSGQQETAFGAVVVNDTSAVFENPAHDFPQRIGYAIVGADSLSVWIEGEAGGATQRIDFPFRRVACAG